MLGAFGAVVNLQVGGGRRIKQPRHGLHYAAKGDAAVLQVASLSKSVRRGVFEVQYVYI